MSTNKELVDKVDRNVKYLSVARLIGLTATVIAATALTVALFVLMFKVYDLSSTIEDCINPTGDCYKNGDRRSGAAVRQIGESQKQIVTVAAYCAKQPGNNTLEQIEACVNKELTR